MAKSWLVIATGFGFLSVALGAFGAHSLKNVLDEYGKSIYEKAVLYQMVHSLALWAVGFSQLFVRNISFAFPGWCFTLGILFFSGSLYFLSLTGIKGLGAVTPIGGVLFLLGWIGFGFGLLKAKF